MSDMMLQLRSCVRPGCDATPRPSVRTPILPDAARRRNGEPAPRATVARAEVGHAWSWLREVAKGGCRLGFGHFEQVDDAFDAVNLLDEGLGHLLVVEAGDAALEQQRAVVI